MDIKKGRGINNELLETFSNKYARLIGVTDNAISRFSNNKNLGINSLKQLESILTLLHKTDSEFQYASQKYSPEMHNACVKLDSRQRLMRSWDTLIQIKNELESKVRDIGRTNSEDVAEYKEFKNEVRKWIIEAKNVLTEYNSTYGSFKNFDVEEIQHGLKDDTWKWVPLIDSLRKIKKRLIYLTRAGQDLGSKLNGMLRRYGMKWETWKMDPLFGKYEAVGWEVHDAVINAGFLLDDIDRTGKIRKEINFPNKFDEAMEIPFNMKKSILRNLATYSTARFLGRKLPPVIAEVATNLGDKAVDANKKFKPYKWYSLSRFKEFSKMEKIFYAKDPKIISGEAENVLKSALLNIQAAARAMIGVMTGVTEYHPSMYIHLLQETKNARQVLNQFKHSMKETELYRKLDHDLAWVVTALKRLRSKLKEGGLEKLQKFSRDEGMSQEIWIKHLIEKMKDGILSITKLYQMDPKSDATHGLTRKISSDIESNCKAISVTLMNMKPIEDPRLQREFDRYQEKYMGEIIRFKADYNAGKWVGQMFSENEGADKSSVSEELRKKIESVLLRMNQAEHDFTYLFRLDEKTPTAQKYEKKCSEHALYLSKVMMLLIATLGLLPDGELMKIKNFSMFYKEQKRILDMIKRFQKERDAGRWSRKGIISENEGVNKALGGAGRDYSKERESQTFTGALHRIIPVMEKCIEMIDDIYGTAYDSSRPELKLKLKNIDTMTSMAYNEAKDLYIAKVFAENMPGGKPKNDPLWIRFKDMFNELESKYNRFKQQFSSELGKMLKFAPALKLAAKSLYRGFVPAAKSAARMFTGGIGRAFAGQGAKAARRLDVGAAHLARAARKPAQAAVVAGKKMLGRRGRKAVNFAAPFVGYSAIDSGIGRVRRGVVGDYEGTNKSIKYGDLYKGLKIIGHDLKKIHGGKARAENITEDKVDPQQLRMGIEVEMEHTDNKYKAKQIALDHLAEIRDYYTRLARMEEEAPKRSKK